MSSTSYYNSLSATAYDGTVGNIRLRWSAAGKDRVYALSQETGAPVETIKALTEHVVYASAHRLQNQQAVIRSPPHDFSVDSKTGAQYVDGLHISCELSGGTGGRSVTHIRVAICSI
nr:hypothetical protein FVER53263_20383 [Fusarium verticillioides]